MAVVYQRPHALLDVSTHYCPGCTHGIIHKLVAQALDELDIEGRTIGIAPVGCSVMAYNYFGCDMIEAAHGRAPAIATGVKRSLPDSVVFTYQGDGDLAAIGTAETVHSATRGENITIIFVNNAIYGMWKRRASRSSRCSPPARPTGALPPRRRSSGCVTT